MNPHLIIMESTIKPNQGVKHKRGGMEADTFCCCRQYEEIIRFVLLHFGVQRNPSLLESIDEEGLQVVLSEQ